MSDEEHRSKKPSNKQISRWRRYLANERAEAAVYRSLAEKRTGSEREILLELADAESRHEQYWRERLGDYVGMPRSPDLGTRFLGFLAKHFGSVFALALIQSAESRNPYVHDDDAPDSIAADERMHAEVVRGLATRSREKMSGGFRAAVFGANDGLISNAALVLGVLGSGMSSSAILVTGISGLLAGAFSMGAGEYISVRSQNELIDASVPHPKSYRLIGQVDVDANELALVYRARGMSEDEARQRAAQVFADQARGIETEEFSQGAPVKSEGSSGAWTAAASSFIAFSIGAFIPIIPYLLGMTAMPAGISAVVLVSIALLFTGGVTGILSGKPPAPRAARQLLVGLGAALVTFVLGAAFGSVIG
ncbi:rubrerythrin family protein [Corynebacterium yudongzhengii]|uniref:Rubrerythrin family protein n=1 Tax=Corynebacterium yudongzhengii TaxID=2080740 RepID=A0A2U1T7U1_9CORY|nr:VIT1/CCC1 transporter family protein [Corynebacterium yudongzhengii]AWB81470.1 rubrerythrin family protein [Corynebacterium yudongzhengii]PWC01958.1 rubrerythrin family protein [Corynebacterium yudongzhengii]